MLKSNTIAIKGNVLNDIGRKESLCNYCPKIDCCWMRDCIPVNGWDAIKRPYSKHHGRTYTYHVFNCPLCTLPLSRSFAGVHTFLKGNEFTTAEGEGYG